MTLDVLISTISRAGIERVAAMELPRVEGVRYIVSWQRHEGLEPPGSLRRDDVILLRLDGVGLSRNRNNAIRHASADIILFADDDIEYLPDVISRVRSAFVMNPAADIILFKAIYPHAKRYPEASSPLRLPLPKGYYVSSIEIACRRQSLGDLRFCESLGLGAPVLTAGEDEYFIYSALRRGLQCRFENDTICRHPAPTTGSGGAISDGALRASGCLISIFYPHTAFLRLPLKAWRISRKSPGSAARPSRSLHLGRFLGSLHLGCFLGSLHLGRFLRALRLLLQGTAWRRPLLDQTSGSSLRQAPPSGASNP